MDVVIVSCDKNQDIWQPFFKLYKKYWKHDYKTYIVTEELDCEYAETIKTKGSWTSRVRQALEKLDSKNVLLLLDDFFFHGKVNQKRIEQILTSYNPNTAVYNLEMCYFIPENKTPLNGFIERENKEPYLNSCQPSIWDRKILIERLQGDKTPWEWEYTTVDSKYKHYINVDELIFDIGYYEDKKPWCIVQGKWSTECIELFKRENIDIDFSKRGICDIELSIIIPYYKTLELTKKLLDMLVPQLNNKVEVILVDDGCNELELDKYPIRVIHQNNGGVSSARNTGLNYANGKYIAFIDSDDMVSVDYVEKILVKDKKDYCYISWKSKKTTVIIEKEPPEWNQSVWNCVFKRELIGNKRFRETLQYGEDMDFGFKVKKGQRTNITDILYYYNDSRENSLTDLYSKGKIEKEKPFKAQIVMFLRFVSKIGGVETFLYEFFKEYHDKHDILFLYEESDPVQLIRYKKFVKCRMYLNEKVECETFLNVNCGKNIADNVTATSGNYYDMCHTDYSAMGWKYTKHPKTTLTICVSEVVKRAFKQQYSKEPCEVISNLLSKPTINKIDDVFNTDGLKLISATRLSWEKGYKRMKTLAKRLNELNIDFKWLVFTNDVPDEDIPNFIFMKPVYNICDYIVQADYLLQLSNTEADGYSTKEAFSVGTPVITTNYPSIYEQGIDIGKNGYVLEMDMSNMDEIIKKMCSKSLKGFKYEQKGVKEKWQKKLGKEVKSEYKFDEKEAIAEQIPDEWIALMRMKDDEGKIILAGEQPILKKTERIRILLENQIIRRKE